MSLEDRVAQLRAKLDEITERYPQAAGICEEIRATLDRIMDEDMLPKHRYQWLWAIELDMQARGFSR